MSGQLDFKINMGGPSDAQPAAAQPAAGSSPYGDTFLSKAAHPVACIFHLLFKSLALVCYIFLNLFLDNFILTFIIVILLSAFDFWTVQNVTGRLLVGLRWNNRIKEDGTEEWVFESLTDDSKLNAVDTWVFWLAIVAAPIVWVVFFIANILAFNAFWGMCTLVNVILTSSNAIGYYKCRKDHKSKLKGLLGQNAMKLAANVGL